MPAADSNERLSALAKALGDAMRPVWPTCSVQVLLQVDSTNTQLLGRARQGNIMPSVMLALEQTAGRGRMGRGWHGKPGDALMISLACALAPKDWAGLSLAVGLAVANALHPDVTLKWPNDLWLGRGAAGRKLGGILIETASMAAFAPAQVSAQDAQPRWCVLGLGLNLVAPPQQQVALRTPPAALLELLPQADLEGIALCVAPALARALLRFEALGFVPFAQAFAQRDALAQNAVKLSDGTLGIARGVAQDGALLVHTEAGLRRVSSDEVSVSARVDV